MITIEDYTGTSVDLRRPVHMVTLDEAFAAEDDRHRHEAMACQIFLPAEPYERRAHAYLDGRLASEQSRQFLATHCGSGVVDFEPVQLAKFRNGVVSGNGSVVTSGGGLIKESIFEWLNFGGTPPSFVRMDETTLAHAPRASYAVPRRAVVLKVIPAYVNYGHWLIEGVSAALLLRERILAEECAIVIPKTRDVAMREVIYTTLLNVFGGDDRVVAYERDIADAIRFDELYYLTSLHIPLRKSPSGIAAVRQVAMAAASRFGGIADLPRRLYISRADANTRRVLNEPELVEHLGRHGFTTLRLKDLDFLTQVRLFMNADIVVGAKGAGMTNIMFMDPKGRVISLSPDDFPDPFEWDIAQHVGLSYAEIYGVSRDSPYQGAGFRDFTIELDQLEAALAKCGVRKPRKTG